MNSNITHPHLPQRIIGLHFQQLLSDRKLVELRIEPHGGERDFFVAVDVVEAVSLEISGVMMWKLWLS